MCNVAEGRFLPLLLVLSRPDGVALDPTKQRANVFNPPSSSFPALMAGTRPDEAKRNAFNPLLLHPDI